MTEQQSKLYNSLTDYWQTIVDDLVQSLIDVGRYASGNTAQSIGAMNPIPITLTSTGFKVQISMPDYYQYIDEGVSGAKNNTGISRFKYTDKMPPISAIRKFMRNRAIDPAKRSNTKSGKRRDDEDIRNSIAFVIARSIYENGLKKTNFYTNVINDQKILDFEKRLLDQYTAYIIGIIKID